ncbi:MAG: asparagine--tRNA ligase [Gracilibacteraceae bacterium]|jgi:asparaginyl-tRNA synthetase|nr:asparagine--tRNA ligase [Gracilibacteraceae bacterium]
MKIISAQEVFLKGSALVGSEVRLEGWVRTVRASKDFGFVECNDGSCFLNVQIVFDEELPNFAEAARLSVGSSVRVEGVLVESPGANQPFEIRAKVLEIVTMCPPEYPLQKKRHSVEFLRTIAHLRPRTNLFAAVFRVRSVLAFAVHRFFQERGFVHVHTPIITASDAEGAGEMFRVTALRAGEETPDFFGREAHLTVSGQLNAEAFCLAYKRVYTFGPTFRAENSNTARHAAEFWMIEPEVAFAGLDDACCLAEEMMKFLIEAVSAACPEEMAFFSKFVDKDLFERLEGVLAADFARVSYTEAVKMLLDSGQVFEFPVVWGRDLQSEHERFLTERVFGKPVFLTDYPRDIKAFYMRQNDDGRTVAAMDLLVPGVGEIIGGSQREERVDFLERRLDELGMAREEYQWYLDLRRFGGAPHAGFGLGFERLLMYVTGVSNIRDVIPFPRTVRSVDY